MSSVACFAGTFSVNETTPVNGQKETSIDNLCVKMYFDQDVSFEKTLKGQKALFKIEDKDGKRIPIKVLYDKKEHVILALAYDEKTNSSSNIVEQNAEYTFTVDKALKDDQGDTFAPKDQESVDENGNFQISFTTQNTKRASTVNFIMMAVMFGGIFFFSSRSMKKQQQEDEKEKKRAKVNPYEEARRTGKSVEEIIAREEKQKAKDAAKKQKREEARRKQEAEELEALRATYYKVSKPRPISEAGSKIVSGKGKGKKK